MIIHVTKNGTYKNDTGKEFSSYREAFDHEQLSIETKTQFDKANPHNFNRNFIELSANRLEVELFKHQNPQ